MLNGESSWQQKCITAEDRLFALCKALGGYGAISFDDNGRVAAATPDELARLVELLRKYRDVRLALHVLTDEYRSPIKEIDSAMDTLRDL